MVPGEVVGVADVGRNRLVDGDEPERRLQGEGPGGSGGEQRLGVVDAVDGYDDIGAHRRRPAVGRSSPDDDVRVGRRFDEARTHRVGQRRRQRRVVVAGEAQDRARVVGDLQQRFRGIVVDDDRHVGGLETRQPGTVLGVASEVGHRILGAGDPDQPHVRLAGPGDGQRGGECPGGELRAVERDDQCRKHPDHGPFVVCFQAKALTPVMSRPTMRVWIVSVPSKV